MKVCQVCNDNFVPASELDVAIHCSREFYEANQKGYCSLNCKKRADNLYDSWVTNRSEENNCSCHLYGPCDFCIKSSDN